MNRNILIISIGLGIILIIILFVTIFFTYQQQERDTEDIPAPSPMREQDTQTMQNNDTSPTNKDTILIDNEVIIEPTRMTPVPPPPSLDELNELLQDPMDYETITIRYSQQRDTYIIYFAGNQEEAIDDFTNLMSEYGYDDISQLNIEYENLEAPLLERPPVTITLPDEP